MAKKQKKSPPKNKTQTEKDEKWPPEEPMGALILKIVGDFPTFIASVYFLDCGLTALSCCQT